MSVNWIILREDVARDVFDVAVNSMDFSSGFLDSSQVKAMRAYAMALDVDPWEATPSNHRPDFCPGHEWVEQEANRYLPGGGRHCRVCHKLEAYPFTPPAVPVSH